MVWGERTFSVDPWVVPDLFTGVNVDPPPLVLAVHLGPNQVLAVPDPSDPCAGSATKHAETVGEFAGPPSSGLK